MKRKRPTAMLHPLSVDRLNKIQSFGNKNNTPLTHGEKCLSLQNEHREKKQLISMIKLQLTALSILSWVDKTALECNSAYLYSRQEQFKGLGFDPVAY